MNYKTFINKEKDKEIMLFAQAIAKLGYLKSPVTKYQVTKFALDVFLEWAKRRVEIESKSSPTKLISEPIRRV
jgi:hypothetical protein